MGFVFETIEENLVGDSLEMCMDAMKGEGMGVVPNEEVTNGIDGRYREESS